MHTRKLRFKPIEDDSFYKTDQHGECLNTITKCRNKTVKLLITNDEMIKTSVPRTVRQTSIYSIANTARNQRV